MTWFVVVALVGLLIVWAFWPRRAFTQYRRVDRLCRKFRELLDGSPKPTVLILEASRNGPFLQFSHFSDLVANFPLVTEQHLKLESKFREAIDSNNLSVSYATGTDGARFLEVKLPQKPEAAAKFAELILIEVFGLDQNSRVKTKRLFTDSCG
jgi:hypothetical protein